MKIKEHSWIHKRAGPINILNKDKKLKIYQENYWDQGYQLKAREKVIPSITNQFKNFLLPKICAKA